MVVPMQKTYLKYILPAVSIVVGMTMCVAYSLGQEDPVMLWGGLLLITAVSMATYALFDDSE
jgi:hypothetical protein